MKKIIWTRFIPNLICISFIFVILGIACSHIFAIPAEGEFLPALHQWAWGMQFNHIFSRDFNKVEGCAQTTQYFIRTSYGINERLFLDGKIGCGNIIFKREDDVKLNFPVNFAGGYGIRYLCYENPASGIKSIFGIQHISCHPYSERENDLKYSVIWDEWQGALLFIKEWEKTAVYIGSQYSSAQLKYKVEQLLRQRLKSEDNWGAIIGGNYRLKRGANINVEARLFDEWALNLGIDYNF